jgi:O-antigen/teichoic acid export membrane protein
LIKEILLSLAIGTLAALVLNPMDFWMPDMATMTVAAGLFIAFVAFAALIWREHPADEREAAHASRAGRVGYIAGTAGLTVGLIAQILQHAVDPWMVITLVLMVFAKVASRVWDEMRN